MIFEHKGIEYNFEYRTVLDGIHQILMNKSITEEFIFEYKLSKNVSVLIYLKIYIDFNIDFFLIFIIKGFQSTSIYRYV
jgi:hypothetical protein